MRYTTLLKPVGQPQQIACKRPEASLLLTALPAILRPQNTRRDTLLMHVQTTAARIHDLHRLSPLYRAALDACKKRKSPMRALRNFRRPLFVVLPSVPVILVCGLHPAPE